MSQFEEVETKLKVGDTITLVERPKKTTPLIITYEEHSMTTIETTEYIRPTLSFLYTFIQNAPKKEGESLSICLPSHPFHFLKLLAYTRNPDKEEGNLLRYIHSLSPLKLANFKKDVMFHGVEAIQLFLETYQRPTKHLYVPCAHNPTDTMNRIRNYEETFGVEFVEFLDVPTRTYTEKTMKFKYNTSLLVEFEKLQTMIKEDYKINLKDRNELDSMRPWRQGM